MSKRFLTPRLLLICIMCAVGLSGCREQTQEPLVVVPTSPSGDSPQAASTTPGTRTAEVNSLESAGLVSLPTAVIKSIEQNSPPETREVNLEDPHQGSTGQTLYQVNFVTEDDILNLRLNPGAGARIISTFPPGTRGILVTGEGRWLDSSLWVPVKTGDKSGWVNSRYLVEEVPPENFCSDEALETFLDQLIEAVDSRDAEAFASLVEPGRGLRIRRHWWNPEVLVEAESLANIFSSQEIYNWGVADGSGEDIDGTFKDVILPLLEKNLLAASQVTCGEILHGGTAGIVQLPAPYEGINYYSFYRPPGSDQVELDWGTWVVGIESWHGVYKLSFLVHYEWEI